jgi:hypothetical protein
VDILGTREAVLADPQSLDGLASDASSEFVVLVEVKHGEPGALRRSGYEQVGHGRAAVQALIGQQHLDLDGTLFYRWGEVFDRHERQRRAIRGGGKVRSRPGGESGLERGHSADADAAAADPICPELRIRTGGETDKGRLVDEPGRHCQA